ncbi:hypothetical protein FEM08_22890 [Flavobacterium gilvum]|nr:hypothetical protein FEM08_22890 [Flavobacterium gilvum]
MKTVQKIEQSFLFYMGFYFFYLANLSILLMQESAFDFISNSSLVSKIV